VPIWFYLLPLVWILLMIELYEPHTAANWRRTLRGIALAGLVGLIGYSLVFTINLDPNSLPRIAVGAFLLLASVLTVAWRGLYIRFYTTSRLMRRVLILGAGKAGRTLLDVYSSLKPPPFSLVGFVDDDPQKRGKTFHGVRVLGSSKRLLEVIDEFRISDLVIAITGEIGGAAFQSVLDAQSRGVEVIRMPTMYEEMTGRVPVHHLESDWAIRSFVDDARVSGTYELLKRLMDLVGGTMGILLFLASYPFAALATLLNSGLPILYAQTRLGLAGRLFVIYKFRTMRQDAEGDGEVRTTLEQDPRVTRVGGFLRRTRLDELPQFWNVLRGEMSLVGPRAERPELIASYQKQIPFYRSRFLVKPGLTGWAQINHGYAATVYDTVVKLEYDLYYITHRDLWMDIRIVLRTVGTVIGFRGR
jgi:exopolysaccharide biosynthesis polyprenyl glycosylphosphotransferase